MGSFGGVEIDAENFQQTVDLAQQKALLEQSRNDVLSQTLMDYRNGLTQPVANNLLVNSEKLLRKNVTGVLKQDMPYNLLLTTSEQDRNRVNCENRLPYKTGGVLKAGTKVRGDLYAQDLRPIDGGYNEWLTVKVPNSFGGEVRIGSASIYYDLISKSDNQYEDTKIKLLIVGAIVLGLLLSDE